MGGGGSKMVDLNPAISKVTLNVNGLTILIKKQRLSNWVFPVDTYVCVLCTLKTQVDAKQKGRKRCTANGKKVEWLY